MHTLIFDIETIGEEWDKFDAVTQDALTSWIYRSTQDKVAQNTLLEDVKSRLSFSPCTGRKVSIAVYDLEREQGAVYYAGTGDTDESLDGFVYKQRGEASLLKDFWEGAHTYDAFVTFNGRAFDVPFLIHRSLAHDITPSKQLMKHRYLSRQNHPYHVDLLDELTFYGAMRRTPNLHLFCRTYGIASPKSNLSGNDVSTLYREGRYKDIAQYNVGDVIAIRELYQKWRNHIAPAPFDLL